MEAEVLNEYAYLWDGSDPDWVLLELPSGRQKVVNKRTGVLLLIEDSTLAAAVVSKLKELGREILSEAPDTSPFPPQE